MARSSRTLRSFATSPNIRASKRRSRNAQLHTSQACCASGLGEGTAQLATLEVPGPSVLLSRLLMIVALLVLIFVGVEAKLHA
jgi:hypothetical protein